MRSFKRAWAMPVVLGCTLVACGGGGGGGGGFAVLPALAPPSSPAPTPEPPAPTPQVQEFDLASAYLRYLAGSAHYTLSGTGTILNYRYTVAGQESISAPAAGSFNGASGLTKTTEATITTTNAALASDSSTERSTTNHHYDSNYRWIGTTWANSSNYEEVESPALPAKVRPGDRGLWYTSTLYRSGAARTVVQRTNATYEVTRESDQTAFLTVTLDVTSPSNPRYSTTQRYRLHGDGRFSKNQVSLGGQATLQMTIDYTER